MSIASVKHDGAGGFVTTLVDGSALFVPNDPANRHHIEITRRAALDPGDSDFLAIGASDLPPPKSTMAEIYDLALQTEPLLRAVVLSINDGTLVPGANATGATLKTIIKAKM